MDRFRTMESFVRVARAGSFTAAAAQLGISRALVSRHVVDLEARLGVRLLNRSTRALGLTDEGAEYLESCERVFGEMEKGEQNLARTRGGPIGSLKLLAPKSFGSLHLADAVIAFAASQPEIRVSLVLDDFSFRSYDFLESGFDLAIRLNRIRDSRVIARRLGTLEWVLCAAPDYLAREGTPRTPRELSQRACLAHLNLDPHDRIWRFQGPRGTETARIKGPFQSNSALVLRKAALAGRGVGLLPRYCIAPDLAAGTLVPLLPRYKVPERPIFAVYPRATMVVPKIRLFVGFLASWLGSQGFAPGTRTARP